MFFSCITKRRRILFLSIWMVHCMRSCKQSASYIGSHFSGNLEVSGNSANVRERSGNLCSRGNLIVAAQQNNLPVLYSHCNSFFIRDVHREFGLVNAHLFDIYCPCNFVWKSPEIFLSGEWWWPREKLEKQWCRLASNLATAQESIMCDRRSGAGQGTSVPKDRHPNHWSMQPTILHVLNVCGLVFLQRKSLMFARAAYLRWCHCEPAHLVIGNQLCLDYTDLLRRSPKLASTPGHAEIRRSERTGFGRRFDGRSSWRIRRRAMRNRLRRRRRGFPWTVTPGKYRGQLRGSFETWWWRCSGVTVPPACRTTGHIIMAASATLFFRADHLVVLFCHTSRRLGDVLPAVCFRCWLVVCTGWPEKVSTGADWLFKPAPAK